METNYQEVINNILKRHFVESSSTIKSINENISSISKMVTGIYDSQLNGGKLLIGGNGGSSSLGGAGAAGAPFQNGNDGTFGGGGGGAGCTNKDGGDGGDGYIEIKEYS